MHTPPASDPLAPPTTPVRPPRRTVPSLGDLARRVAGRYHWLALPVLLAATAAVGRSVEQPCVPWGGLARYELAGTAAEADRLVRSWGAGCRAGGHVIGAAAGLAEREAEVRSQLRTSTARDFLLIPLYAALFAAACRASADAFGRGALGHLARRAAWVPAAAGTLDVLENVALLRELGAAGGAAAAGAGREAPLQAAQLAAGLKFTLLAATGALVAGGVVIGVWRILRRRTRAATRAQSAAGAAGAVDPAADARRASARLAGGHTEAATLDKVLHAELRYLTTHRHAGRSGDDVGRNLVGLALSGGGIRSATTSLGVLQALSRLDVLPMVDYLSTVSGGGYIGSALSAYLSLSRTPPRPGAPPAPPDQSVNSTGAQAAGAASADPGPALPGRRPFPQLRFPDRVAPAFATAWARFPFRTPSADPEADGGGEPVRLGTDLVAHLRTHGDFLIARRGLLRRDGMRALGTVLTGVTYNFGLFALTLAAATAVYLAAVLTLSPGLPIAYAGPTAFQTAAAPPEAVTLTRAAPAGTAFPPSLVPGDSTVVQARATPCAGAGCRVETRTTYVPASAVRRVADNVARVGRAAAAHLGAWHPVGLDGAPTSWHRGAALWRGAPPPLRVGLFGGAAGVLAVVLAYGLMQVRLGAYVRGDALPPDASGRDGDSAEDRIERRALWLAAGLLGVGVAATLALTRWSAWGRALVGADAIDRVPARQLVWVAVPLAVFVGARAASAAGAVLVLPRLGQRTRRARSLWGGIQAITLYGLWAAAAMAAFPLVVYGTLGAPLLGLGGGGAAALAATRLLSARRAAAAARSGAAPRGPAARWGPSPGLRRALLGAAVALVLALAALFCGVALARALGRTPDAAAAWRTAAALAAAFVALGYLVDMNQVSLHTFYRDRLAETYLRADLPDARLRLHAFHDAMEMPLHYLHGVPEAYDDATRPDGTAVDNPAPYHLISAAINLAGSRDLTRKDRRSGYWLFSKLYCGSTHTGFRPTHRYREGETSLARAVAVSGAAASSGIGFGTFFAQAFAAVLFNVRLGFWMENPRRRRSMRSREGWTFWPYFLWKEVVMDTTERDWLVNLSDGGHTGDNVGIYPLLQRRCKVIVAVDAERDPALTFGSFTEALRQAYVDLGVSVDIDLAMLRPDAATGLSRSHCAVGRIFYPDRPDQHSVLVYVKSSLTGDEQEPVLNYKSAQPDFPHESTVDQFFDDAQFESYRALGVHMAEHAFGSWAGSPAGRYARAYHGENASGEPARAAATGAPDAAAASGATVAAARPDGRHTYADTYAGVPAGVQAGADGAGRPGAGA